MISNNNLLKPFLRWAGGKQWLVPELISYIPKNNYTYYEPFIGGGSLFFATKPKKSFLSDMNKDLIDTYKILRDYPNHLISILKKWENDKDTYYYIRNLEFDNEISKAAQFIYLNKTCWNGLYRVNRKGKFNVPFGYNNRKTFTESNIIQCSRILKNANLNHNDYEQSLKTAKTGDFIYLDPPYTVLHSKNGFRQYNEKLFTWDDQIRLADIAFRLYKSGCYVVISNANNNEIINLYPDFRYKEISRHSVIAANPSYRCKITELLFISKT